MHIRYSGGRTVKMACSICSTPFEFGASGAEGGRFCVDKLFRCNRFCTEKVTNLDYDRAQSASRSRVDDLAPLGPMGPRPTGH
jgi:hypothetical protein